MKITNAEDFFGYIHPLVKQDTEVKVITFNMTVFGDHEVVTFLDKLINNNNHRIIVSVPLLNECKPQCKDCRIKFNKRIEKLNEYARRWNIRFMKESHLKFYKIGNRAFLGGVNLSPSRWADGVVELNRAQTEIYDEMFENIWKEVEYNRNVDEIPLNYIEPPTEKQLKFINSIEEELEIEFSGKSKEDAKEFISEHINDFYRSQSGPSWAEENGYY